MCQYSELWQAVNVSVVTCCCEKVQQQQNQTGTLTPVPEIQITVFGTHLIKINSPYELTFANAEIECLHHPHRFSIHVLLPRGIYIMMSFHTWVQFVKNVIVRLQIQITQLNCFFQTVCSSHDDSDNPMITVFTIRTEFLQDTHPHLSLFPIHLHHHSLFS